MDKQKNKKNHIKHTKEKNDKGDDIMSAVARNFVYEVKVKPNSNHKEKIVSKEFLDSCKKVAEKYPKR